VPNTGLLRLRTRKDTCFPFFIFGLRILVLLKCSDGLNGFNGFVTSGTCKVSGKIFSALSISFVVQGDSVSVVVIPRGLSHVIEGFGIGFNSGHKDFWRDKESQFDRSYHIHIYVLQRFRRKSLLDLKKVGNNFRIQDRRMRQFLPTHKGWGSLAA
jgi:hypothetical protein